MRTIQITQLMRQSYDYNPLSDNEKLIHYQERVQSDMQHNTKQLNNLQLKLDPTMQTDFASFPIISCQTN